ncbi:MAG: hypothetical protein ACJATP_003062, partial [Candidatus Azotimanducaceae bacterium]
DTAIMGRSIKLQQQVKLFDIFGSK